MKTNFFSLLVVSALLAGCCCDTPETETKITDSMVAVTPGSRQEFACNVGDRVYFAFDKSSLDHQAHEVLGRQAEWLKKYNYEINIVGHCDERGTTEYNLALGERRAEAVRQALIKKGIDSSRIKIYSKGKEDPLVEGHNEEAWSKNRTAITVLIGELPGMVAPAAQADVVVPAAE